MASSNFAVIPREKLAPGPPKTIRAKGIESACARLIQFAAEEPISQSQPHRVHGMVEPGSRQDYDSAGISECR